MFEPAAIVYRYDGSFEGLLCCIFESFVQKEIPFDILPPQRTQEMLYPVRQIKTDTAKARRVMQAIPKKIGKPAAELVLYGFLSYQEQKELMILRFLQLGFSIGPKVMRLLADEAVAPLQAAVRHLTIEAHRYSGFIRFSIYESGMVAIIEPRNQILPMIRRHFCSRYPGETFCIYDKTHGYALLHQPGNWRIIPVEELELPEISEEEREMRRLWKQFYDTIAIEGRFNPKCRMTMCPKRYWGQMLEMQGE